MVGEVDTVDVLHHQVQVVIVAARVVHGDQARVVDLRGDAALAHEPAAQLSRFLALPAIRSADLVRAQQFDRDAPIEALVVAAHTWPMPPCPMSEDSS